MSLSLKKSNSIRSKGGHTSSKGARYLFSGALSERKGKNQNIDEAVEKKGFNE